VVIAPDLCVPTRTTAGLIFAQPATFEQPPAVWRAALARTWFGRLVVFANATHAEACAGALVDHLADPTSLARPLDPVRAALAALPAPMRATALAGCVRRGAHGPCTPQDLLRGMVDGDARAALQSAFDDPGTTRVDLDTPEPARLQLDQMQADADIPRSETSTRRVRLWLGRHGQAYAFECVARGPRTHVPLPFAPDWIQPDDPAVRLPAQALHAVFAAPDAHHPSLPSLAWRHFEWGVSEADALLDQLLGLMEHDDPPVVLPAAHHLRRMGDELVPKGQRDAFMICVGRAIDAVFARMKTIEPPLRDALLALRVHAPHPTLARELRADAMANLRAGAPPRDLRWAVECTGDAALFDAIVSGLDQTHRPRLIEALGHFTDPALIERAILLYDTPRMRGVS
jgi:hypothetical protein